MKFLDSRRLERIIKQQLAGTMSGADFSRYNAKAWINISELVLRGIHFHSGRSSAVTLQPFVMPLVYPAENLYLTFGDRLHSIDGQPYDKILIDSDADIAPAVEIMQRQLHDIVLPFLLETDSLAKLADPAFRTRHARFLDVSARSEFCFVHAYLRNRYAFEHYFNEEKAIIEGLRTSNLGSTELAETTLRLLEELNKHWNDESHTRSLIARHIQHNIESLKLTRFLPENFVTEYPVA